MCSEIIPVVVRELKISQRQVSAVKALLDEGNTVPFIARYRKEQHNNLDEVQIIAIKDKLEYYRELEDRKKTIIKVIGEQGKLDSALKEKIENCASKTLLEDIYLPYRPKRRTRAMIAREKGLQELADIILEQSDKKPEEEALKFIDVEKELKSVEDVLKGAVDIVAEVVAENAEVRKFARNYIYGNGVLESRVRDNINEPTKYEQYYEYDEKIAAIPSHRFLAIKRGQSEGILKVNLRCDSGIIIKSIEKIFNLNDKCAAAGILKDAIEASYKRLLFPAMEIDVMVECKLNSDRSAIDIFAVNLRNLLMQPPLGRKVVLAVDPGIRTGCKCAVIDATGKFLETKTIYLSKGERSLIEAKVDVCKMIAKYRPAAIAVGNGTGGRETEHFIKRVFKEANIKDTLVVSVNEAGASVYSASETAREEFGDIDLTVRGAISIGRRLQDPLAELVKIDPKAIGVGQYQHDVNQRLLANKLDEVVISCVNQVGVELNTASAPLLTRVSGIGTSLAGNIVEYRNQNGAFKTRAELKKVAGLGNKTFEQAAGFLRIYNAHYPLDSSAVHPERYDLVEKMATDMKVDIKTLIGNAKVIRKITIENYISESVGEPTLRDIISELLKPGRDPRDKFEKPVFRDDIVDIADLETGMILEGIVTNVTAFGAFVDIGVHQDGLVHVSELSERYVKNPSEVVKTGDLIKVRVLNVDENRRRVSLSAKPEKAAPQSENSQTKKKRASENKSGDKRSGKGSQKGGYKSGFTANPFADL